MSSIEHYQPIISQLKDVFWTRDGKGYAKCPAHEDQHRSLSVAVGRNGVLMLKCFAKQGCTFKTIAKSLGREEGEFFPPKPDGPARPARQEIEATYDYTDTDGRFVYQVVRQKNPKGFFQQRKDGRGQWVKDLKGVEQVPYLVHEIAAAPTDRLVVIAEGEKKVQAFKRLGFVATCNAGGSENWRAGFARFFNGRPVAIFPDHDEAGWRHAAFVAATLTPTAGPVRLVELPALKLKADIIDWIAASGGTKDVDLARLLTQIIYQAPIYNPNADFQEKLAELRMQLARAMGMSWAI